MIASVRGVLDLFLSFLRCVLWLFPLLFDGAGPTSVCVYVITLHAACESVRECVYRLNTER